MATYKRGSGNYKSSFLTIHNVVSNELVNNTETLANSIYLKQSLKINKFYTGIVLFRVLSPAAADLDITFEDITGATGDSFSIGGTIINSPSNFGSQLTVSTDASTQTFMIRFWIKTGSTAADLQLQFAQNTATVGDTKILAGTMMMVFES